MTSITLAGLPAPLVTTAGSDSLVRASGADSVVLLARAGDDLFADPAGVGLVQSASLFMFPVVGDFQLSAKVEVEFLADFDSGVLVGYFDDTAWFKICAEIDPLGLKRVVSVVTNGRSDDANSCVLDGPAVHLRISRSGTSFAMHSSADGKLWDMVRYFTLGDRTGQELRIGIAAQSPAGQGTQVRFSDFGWKAEGISDPRDGR